MQWCCFSSKRNTDSFIQKHFLQYIYAFLFRKLINCELIGNLNNCTINRRRYVWLNTCFSDTDKLFYFLLPSVIGVVTLIRAQTLCCNSNCESNAVFTVVQYWPQLYTYQMSYAVSFNYRRHHFYCDFIDILPHSRCNVVCDW